jgi:hypothetical protein
MQTSIDFHRFSSISVGFRQFPYSDSRLSKVYEGIATITNSTEIITHLRRSVVDLLGTDAPLIGTLFSE